MPNSSGSLTAVVVSGGKQYRVASGDRILVDRLPAEPGSELTLDRVLMVADGEDLKVGAEALAGQTVTVRILEHRRGPKIDVLRYRPKKRVRVHRGARAELTAIEVVSVGPPGGVTERRTRKAEPRPTPVDESEQPAPPARRSRTTRPSKPAKAAQPARPTESPEPSAHGQSAPQDSE